MAEAQAQHLPDLGNGNLGERVRGGWQSNTSLTTTPPLADFLATQERARCNPQQGRTAWKRTCGVWLRVSSVCFFPSLCSTPCVLLKGMLRASRRPPAPNTRPLGVEGGLEGRGAVRCGGPMRNPWAQDFRCTSAWRVMGRSSTGHQVQCPWLASG